jgi:hypothetical protein
MSTDGRNRTWKNKFVYLCGGQKSTGKAFYSSTSVIPWQLLAHQGSIFVFICVLQPTLYSRIEGCQYLFWRLLQPSLRVVSRVARAKITINGKPNSVNYWVNFIVHIIYTRGCELQNTSWLVAGWTPSSRHWEHRSINYIKQYTVKLCVIK